MYRGVPSRNRTDDNKVVIRFHSGVWTSTPKSIEWLLRFVPDNLSLIVEIHESRVLTIKEKERPCFGSVDMGQ